MDLSLQKKRELLKQSYFELEVFNQADDPSDSYIDTQQQTWLDTLRKEATERNNQQNLMTEEQKLQLEIDDKVKEITGEPAQGWGSLLVIKKDSGSQDVKQILRFPKVDDYLKAGEYLNFLTAQFELEDEVNPSKEGFVDKEQEAKEFAERLANIAGPPNELTKNLEKYNQKHNRKMEMLRQQEVNLATAKGLYEIVEKGLEKCDDPNDTPIFKREQYLEIKEMLDKADKTSDEILEIKMHVSKMVSEAIKTFDFDAMHK